MTIIQLVIMDVKKLLENKENNIHIIGAGGVGMSGLALLLKNLGFRVSGSDATDNKYLKNLAANGITTWRGSYPDRIEKDSIVFYSTAIGEHEPERHHAEEQGMPIFSRHKLIEFITEKFFTIAITGTHGKTTTTAWCAMLLQNAGLDPCALVGGNVPEWQSNVRIGNGVWQGKPILVMEADESDKSFLNIDASVGAITNIEMDHPDHYKNLDELEKNFYDFITNLVQQKKTLLPSFEFFSHNMFKKAKENFPQAFNDFSDFQEKFSIEKKENANCIVFAGKTYTPRLAGLHNLKNASIVFALAQYMKIDETVLRKTVEEFSGVDRRMQLLAAYSLPTEDQKRYVHIIDDYAHHPTEIEAGLKTLQQEYDYVVVVWEPHRISRLIYFGDAFKKILHSFSGKVFLLPVYFAAEKEKDFLGYQEVCKELQENFESLNLQTYKNLWDFLENTSEIAEQKKIAVAFMGAGRSSEHAQKCVREADKRYEKA